jgi:hypothetical protein
MRVDYEWFIKTDFSKYAGKWIATIDKKGWEMDCNDR